MLIIRIIVQTFRENHGNHYNQKNHSSRHSFLKLTGHRFICTTLPADARFFSSEAPEHQRISVSPEWKVPENPLTKADLFPEVSFQKQSCPSIKKTWTKHRKKSSKHQGPACCGLSSGEYEDFLSVPKSMYLYSCNARTGGLL